jgi:hypothetical protein
MTAALRHTLHLVPSAPGTEDTPGRDGVASRGPGLIFLGAVADDTEADGDPSRHRSTPTMRRVLRTRPQRPNDSVVFELVQRLMWSATLASPLVAG